MRIKADDVPAYLQQTSLYANICGDDDDETQDEVIDIPDGHMKLNTNVENLIDLSDLLLTLRYWIIEKLPIEVLNYCLQDLNNSHHVEELMKVLIEFEKDLPELNEVHNVIKCHTLVARLTCAASHGNERIMQILLNTSSDTMISTYDMENICETAINGDYVNCLGLVVNKLWTANNHYITKLIRSAALKNKIKCFRYIHKKGLGDVFPDSICNEAFQGGSLEILQFMKEKNYSFKMHQIQTVLELKQWHIMKFLLENEDCPLPSTLSITVPPRSETVSLPTALAAKGQLECLKIAIESRRLSITDDYKACSLAAYFGHVKCLQYLHKLSCRWDESTVLRAIQSRNTACLQYALKHGCPITERSYIAAMKLGHVHHYLEFLHNRNCEWSAQTTLAACKYNNLLGLKFACSHGCPLDRNAIVAAARVGNIPMLRYLYEERQCPLTAEACEVAARLNCYTVLVYLHSNGCPWSELTATYAATDLHCLQYVHDNGCPWNPESICNTAASNGKIVCLSYAMENECTPSANTLITACRYGHLDMVKFLLSKGCPLPTNGQLQDTAGTSASTKDCLSEVRKAMQNKKNK